MDGGGLLSEAAPTRAVNALPLRQDVPRSDALRACVPGCPHGRDRGHSSSAAFTPRPVTVETRAKQANSAVLPPLHTQKEQRGCTLNWAPHCSLCACTTTVWNRRVDALLSDSLLTVYRLLGRLRRSGSLRPDRVSARTPGQT